MAAGARLLVVTGGDYAASEFSSRFDPNTMTAAEIRQLVQRIRSGEVKFRARVTPYVMEIGGPLNRALFSAVRRTVGDHDSLKHTDCWLFEE